jgi:oxaloacetate decarboxylase gamma subunit
VPSDLITQGFELMLVGMGTVFVFLTILVFATTAMSKLVSRFFPPEKVPVVVEGVSSEEVAAITAAIARHRQRQ